MNQKFAPKSPKFAAKVLAFELYVKECVQKQEFTCLKWETLDILVQ